ncbi:zincin-like metallopeptidase domain-containing protein [Massilia glaciei]
MESEKKPFHETVAEKLIEQLNQGTAPWQKPWEPGAAGANMPINPTTGKRYKGINALQLMSEGREDQRWMTYKQAATVDAQVRKGEKGTPIQYWKFSEEQNKRDAAGRPILDRNGEPLKETVALERPRVFFATVFNAEQIDGLPPLQPRRQHEWSAVDRAEQILRASGAEIHHTERDRAFYRPSSDSIHVPDKWQFKTADNYYATALHELGHWTGHGSRLDRDLVHPFGSEGYAKEELRAEIASMLLGDELGIGHDPTQHAAYVGSWIKALSDDPLEIFRAAADAEKIQEYIMGLEQKNEQEQTTSMALNAKIDQAMQYDYTGHIDDELAARHEGQLYHLRRLGFVTMQDVTGSNPSLFYETALARLAPAYDLSANTPDTAYFLGLEHQALARDFATKAHELVTTELEVPVAYIDDHGVVRAGDHTELPADWRGVVREKNEFWHAGPIDANGERAVILLSATTLEQAAAEGERAHALAVDVAEVLSASDKSYSHYEAFQGETVEQALRSFLLNTVGDVTGHDPARFHDKALENLSRVFGIEVDHVDADNAYLERKGLAQSFSNMAEQIMMPLKQQATEAEMGVPKQPAALQADADRAEAWTVGRVEKDTLARALDGASQAQLNRVYAVLADMEPLSAANPFWQRNELPQDVGALADKIDAAKERVTVRQADAVVAASRLDLVTGVAFGRERSGDGDTFDRDAEENLGFTLPHNWTGRVQVQGNIKRDIDGEMIVLPAAHRGEKPDFWGVYAQLDDGHQEHLADRPTEQQADELAERLAVIDARSTISEHEKAAKLARVNEDRVRRNPDSTDEDISAAKEARKNAEFAATTNDADLQRRIEFEERQRTLLQQAPADARRDAPKTLLTVPYKEKEEVKALGAKWDRKDQSWYVPQHLDAAPFAKWAQQPAQMLAGESLEPATALDKPAVSKAVEGRVYLAVTYRDRTEAKGAGAEWDKAAKSWYAGPHADMAKLDKWKPENVPTHQGPAMAPREEFAAALASIGCVVPAGGDHPIMDGEKHRISVEGEKFSKNSGSGFYVGHLDGYPAGFMKNNKTGAELTWKAKGYTLDPEQKALLASQAAEKLQQREAELSKLQEQAAKRVGKELGKLVQVTVATPYMQAKGIVPHAGALTDKDGKKTYLPATDVDGKQWTTQYIKEDGTKRFAKDSRKEGCFHVVGGMDELAKAPAIVIGEGYATAAQLKQSLGFPTVSAFDSGNLAAVAQALHQKFPDKPVVIAGDDDRHLELTQGANPGRSKAAEAANLVGGKLMMPIFAPGENSYPADLATITPDLYREHQRTGKVLDDEQLAALKQMKQFTDFNDLANKSALGSEGIDRQVRSLVESVIGKHQASLSVQQQEQVQEQQQELDRGEKVQQVQNETPKRRRSAKVA